MEDIKDNEVFFGELCSKCQIGRMEHPEAYIFECSYCHYKYKFDPSNRPPYSLIRESNFGKRSIKSTPRKILETPKLNNEIQTTSNSPKKPGKEMLPTLIGSFEGKCPFNPNHRLVSYHTYCKNQGISDPDFPDKRNLLYCRYCDMIFQETKEEVQI